MNEIVIKDEFNNKNQCQTCLSYGRKLKPIGEYFEIYKKIVSDYPVGSYHDVFQVLLCWECESMLKKAQQFQNHVRKVNEALRFGQNYVQGTLSNLTTILLNETHPNIIYFYESSIKTDKNHENTPEISDDDNSDARVSEIKTENTEVKRNKKLNKWALKRAEKNKKPKFKIIENSSQCYRTVKMGVEEMGRVTQTEKKNECVKTNYKCMNCSDGFNQLKLLIKHNKECKKDPSNYFCDICKKKFLDKRHLSAHVQKHYDKYSCMLCSYVSYDEDYMKIHAQKEHKRIFQCTKCGLKFGHRREFFKHYKEWHEKFICDYCGISFKMRYCIKDHIRKQHSPFECKPCNKRFARYGGLWLHNKTRHSTPSAGAYCVECDKNYVDVYRYRWHLNNSARHKRINTKRRIPCPSCDKVFTKNIYMKDHYNLVHLKNYKYRCEECDKNFVRNADLVKHKRRVHEGILPPKNKICYMCGRGFTSRKILTNHVRTHTGERPYSCACGARFAQAAALTAHKRARGHDNVTTC